MLTAPGRPPASAPLRIVVMGTGGFAVPMLESLVASAQRIVAVVTRPDHAAAGRRPPPNPVREAAAAARLPVLDPESVNAPEAIARLESLEADIYLVCDYGQILSRPVLSLPPLGGLNLHGSLLPRHRGAAPVQWAILEDDAITGVSVIHMTPALDAGNVLAVRATPIEPHETAVDLERRLAALGPGAVSEAIDRLTAAVAAGEVPSAVGEPQNAALVTRAPRLAKGDGVVNWSEPAARIERLRRALEPWPRLATFFTRGDGRRERLVLEEVVVVPPGETAVRPDGAPPGTVLSAGGDLLTVACGAGTELRIERLVPEGRRSMSSAEFLRGSPLRPGARLGEKP